MLSRYTCTGVPRHHLSVCAPSPLSLSYVCVCARAWERERVAQNVHVWYTVTWEQVLSVDPCSPPPPISALGLVKRMCQSNLLGHSKYAEESHTCTKENKCKKPLWAAQMTFKYTSERWMSRAERCSSSYLVEWIIWSLVAFVCKWEGCQNTVSVCGVLEKSSCVALAQTYPPAGQNPFRSNYYLSGPTCTLRSTRRSTRKQE